MAKQLHNLGYLRKNVEDALVTHLQTEVEATVRPAFTTDKVENPCVVIHAKNTRERNETEYNLARYVDVELRCITYAEKQTLLDAREAHYELVASVYHAIAQADIVKTLNALGHKGVAFWSLYAKTDEGTIAAESYVTIIQVEVGATPQPY